jgi:LAO/AO transport system kinase
LQRHVEHLRRAGALEERHRNQRVEAMWATVRDDLDRRLRDNDEVRKLAGQLEARVRAGELSPVHAADAVVERFLHP